MFKATATKAWPWDYHSVSSWPMWWMTDSMLYDWLGAGWLGDGWPLMDDTSILDGSLMDGSEMDDSRCWLTYDDWLNQWWMSHWWTGSGVPVVAGPKLAVLVVSTRIKTLGSLARSWQIAFHLSNLSAYCVTVCLCIPDKQGGLFSGSCLCFLHRHRLGGCVPRMAVW